MQVVAYFAHLKGEATFVASVANLTRINKLSWMIEKLKLYLQQYNAMNLMTRDEMDDAVRKYRPCIGQHNWMMQKFLDTNSGVRRQEAERTAAHKLFWPKWWEDPRMPDNYR